MSAKNQVSFGSPPPLSRTDLVVDLGNMEVHVHVDVYVEVDVHDHFDVEDRV